MVVGYFLPTHLYTNITVSIPVEDIFVQRAGTTVSVIVAITLDEVAEVSISDLQSL